jgi:hypothetical protein
VAITLRDHEAGLDQISQHSSIRLIRGDHEASLNGHEDPV